jgi:hypothetical protein
MKKPNDYEQKLKLSEVKSLNFYPIIEKIVNIAGWYSCMLNNKKTLIVK